MDFKETIDGIVKKAQGIEADARRPSIIRLDALATKPEVGLWWHLEAISSESLSNGRTLRWRMTPT